MTTNTETKTIDLPGLVGSSFETNSAAVHIGAHESADTPHAQLVIEGSDAGISHEYEDGELSVKQADGEGSAAKISLLLPADHADKGMGHDVKTKDGDITVGEVVADSVIASSAAGNLVVNKLITGIASFQSGKGDVNLNNVASVHNIAAHSDTGNVEIQGGAAPYWRATSLEGNITADENVQGKVAAQSQSGNVSVPRETDDV